MSRSRDVKATEIFHRHLSPSSHIAPKSDKNETQKIFEKKIAYSVQETAQLVGLSTKTIQRSIKAREINVSRIGSRILIRKENIETWLRNKETHGN